MDEVVSLRSVQGIKNLLRSMASGSADGVYERNYRSGERPNTMTNDKLKELLPNPVQEIDESPQMLGLRMQLTCVARTEA